MDPIITLTTDFGQDGPYVAAMKGVILSINPAARLLDLSHQIPPQDIAHAAYFLESALVTFPPGVIHVVVVDPGVGTDRAVLYVEVSGHRLVAPDNGCWTRLVRESAAPRVLRLTEPRFWRQPISHTFHGRDILAPVAAHLSLGVEPALLGKPVTEWVRLPVLAPAQGQDCWMGHVVFVDHFGNLITNIPAEKIKTSPDVLIIGKRHYRSGFRWVRSYAEAKAGSLVALISSSGMLEVAVAQGNAADRLHATVGTAVTIGWEK